MYKRIFVIVLDSLGIGEADDAKQFNDLGSNTLLSVVNARKKYKLDHISNLGLLNLLDDKKYHQSNFKGVICKLNELSKGKDTLTGHYEMMGLETKTPSKTFTDTGFPLELISLLESKWNRKIICNKSASGTKIIQELGKQHIESGNVIVYTSADSVMQIAAHEDIVPLDELYKMCLIAREVTMEPKWKVDRIIARPFIGDPITGFKRTSNRVDYSLAPFATTYLDNLKEAGLDVIGIGKIRDIFNGQGLTTYQKSISNQDGMDKTINLLKNEDFKGLCFVNLVEFDSEYGHRRDCEGYLGALEDFDVRLNQFIKDMRNDDLLILTADHGNDPSYEGTDHTREKVFFIAYDINMKSGRILNEQTSFGVIGASIIDNFKIEKKKHQIGTSILKKIRGEI